jgi:hypothetical protein
VNQGTPFVPSSAGNEKPDTALARVLDFMDSEKAKLDLYRWVTAFRVHENDALLPLLGFFEKQRWDLERYPAVLEDTCKKVLADVQHGAAATAEKAVAQEIAKVQAALNQAITDAIAAAAKSVGKAQAKTSWVVVGLWTAAIAAVYGSLFMVCGWELGRGQLPFWMGRNTAERGGVIAKVLGAILGAPAGYWALACAGGALVFTLKARYDRLKQTVLTPVEKRWQFALFGAAILGWLGFAGCVAVLVR